MSGVFSDWNTASNANTSINGKRNRIKSHENLKEALLYATGVNSFGFSMKSEFSDILREFAHFPGGSMIPSGIKVTHECWLLKSTISEYSQVSSSSSSTEKDEDLKYACKQADLDTVCFTERAINVFIYLDSLPGSITPQDCTVVCTTRATIGHLRKCLAITLGHKEANLSIGVHSLETKIA